MKGHEKFVENATMSPETIEKVRHKIDASAMNDHAQEAAANAEEIVRMLTATWVGHEFTPEQCVFSLALATINFRETLPEKFGGKEMFDRVAHEAHLYFHANK